jgi:LacI family transcriptional regulator
MVDIASAAGVSPKTVSRVVNDEQGVHPVTARRVREAIDLLGYRRNGLASSLAGARSSAAIGLVIEDVSNPFYGAMARAIEETCRQHGRILITASSDERPELEQGLVQTLLERRVDGLILVPAARDHTYLRAEIERGTPVVFVDRPPTGIVADTILCDDRGGARIAANYLIGLGHHRIAIVAHGPSVYTADERVQGALEAFEAADLRVDPGLIRVGAYTSEDAERVVALLLDMDNPPTAIFATNNRMAIGAVRALHARGRALDMAAFDEFELADLLPVQLAIVGHDPRALGRGAVDLLFRRLNGDARPPQRVVLPTGLIPSAR